MGGLFGLFNRAGGSSSAGTESPTTSTSGSTTSTSLTAQATPTLPTSGANDTVHAPLAPNPTLTTSPSNTPSPSDQNQKLLTSAFTSTGKSSESPTTSSPTALPASSDHRLTNGTVAGVVIAVAVGFALVTSLATFFITRRRKGFEGKDRHTKSEESSASESKSVRQQEQASKPKVPFMTPTASASAAFDDYIPQPADDATVKHNVNTIMDQIELHVENFYQNSSATPSTRNNAELALFDSPYLAASLASLLPRSKTKTHLIKHALAQHITSSISPTSSHAKSLLPQEFVLLPDAVRSAKTGAKPGESSVSSQARSLLTPQRICSIAVSMASTDLLFTTGPFERRCIPRRTGPANPKHRFRFLEGLCAVEKAGV